MRRAYPKVCPRMRNTAGRAKRSVPWGCGGESGAAAFHEAEHTFGYARASCALLHRFDASPNVNEFMKHYTSSLSDFGVAKVHQAANKGEDKPIGEVKARNKSRIIIDYY